jgi:hypothetical protein
MKEASGRYEAVVAVVAVMDQCGCSFWTSR